MLNIDKMRERLKVFKTAEVIKHVGVNRDTLRRFLGGKAATQGTLEGISSFFDAYEKMSLLEKVNAWKMNDLIEGTGLSRTTIIQFKNHEHLRSEKTKLKLENLFWRHEQAFKPKLKDPFAP